MATHSITVIYDEESGGVNVNAPQNLVVSLGILEAAKAALIARMTQPKPVLAAPPLGLAHALDNGRTH